MPLPPHRVASSLPAPRLTVAGSVMAAVMLAIVVLAVVVRSGATLPFDRWVLVTLRAATDGESAADTLLRQAASAITFFGNTETVAALAAAAALALLLAGWRRDAAMLAGGVALGTMLARVIKIVVARPRPDVVAHLVKVENPSFPSGHAANSSILYLTLALLVAAHLSRARGRALVAAAIVFVALIGGSRLYLGVHWPTDVMAGWAFGGSWAVLTAAIAARVRTLS